MRKHAVEDGNQQKFITPGEIIFGNSASADTEVVRAIS